MNKLSFSGHETFTCKQFWLFKGYNFVKEGNSFNSPDAVIKLGVGKNMVASIRYWLKAFGLLNDGDNLTEIAHYIFGQCGKDQYLEDIGSFWLLHYYLIKTNRASIYNLVFMDFRIERMEFTKKHLLRYIERKYEEVSPKLYRETTVSKDINVFIRTYFNNNDERKITDEDLSSLFYELNLLTHKRTLSTFDDELIDYFYIENKSRKDLPHNIFLYSILCNESYGNSILLNDIYENESRIFAINKEFTQVMLSNIANDENYRKYISFTDTAGIQQLQFKHKPDKFDVLDNYFNKVSKEKLQELEFSTQN